MPWILIKLQINSDWFLVYHRRSRRRSSDGGGGCSSSSSSSSSSGGGGGSFLFIIDFFLCRIIAISSHEWYQKSSDVAHYSLLQCC